MIRFPQLPIGERFELNGEVYQKVTPLLARNESNGAQRMVPRSALVTPLAEVRAATPPSAHHLDAEVVRAALLEHHAQLRALLEPMTERLDENALKVFEQAYAAAQQRLAARLEL